MTKEENAQAIEQGHGAVQTEPESQDSHVADKNQRKKNPKALPLSEAIANAKDFPETEFIWSGINKKGVGFIFGQSKSGKTTICENLGMSLAAGLDTFLGTPLLKGEKPAKVLFISLEERYNTRLARNQKQAKVLNKKVEDEQWRENYLIVNQDLPLYIAGKEEWAILDRLIKDNKPDVVLIDSLTRLSGEEIEKSKVASNLMRNLHKLASDNEITLIIIHHTAKQAGKPLDLASLAGSRVIIQEADFALGINRTRNGTRYIKEVAFRYKAEAEDSVLTFKLNNDGWLEAGENTSERDLTEGQDRRQDDTNQRLILDYLKKHMNPEGIRIKTLSTELVESGTMSKATLHNSLGKLIDYGEVTGKKGVYKLTSLESK